MSRRPNVPCALCGELMWRGRGSLEPGAAMHRACRTKAISAAPHGNRYGKGCRCDPCRERQNARILAYYYAKKRAQRLSAPRPCGACGELFVSDRIKQRHCNPCLSCSDCGGPRAKGEQRCIPCGRTRRRELREAAKPGPTSRVFYGDCIVCNAPFASRYTAVTCSTECRAQRKRDRASDRGHRRRMRQQDGYVAPVNRRKIFERDNWRCHICRKKVSKTAVVPHPRAATIDHLVPLALMGTHEPANVATACFACNCLKGDRGGNEQLALIG